MIQLENVKKIYKTKDVETVALQDVSLHIKKNEFVAIMGTSGSGKSTLLNILGCMDMVSGGEYCYDGNKIHEFRDTQLHNFRKNHVSFIFQRFELMNRYTVYENIELPLLAKNVKKKRRREIVEQNLELLGIKELSKKLPTQISGGQQQKCAVARALASGNELFLADEPTGALDLKNGNTIIEILDDIQTKTDKTIIVVTHDMEIAKRAGRIIYIEDGKIINEA